MSDEFVPGRRTELAGRLERVRERIAESCSQVGRGVDDVTLVVVTKAYPAADVSALASLGVTDVGEARHPEARDKQAASVDDLVWHFVGAVQTNKAPAIAAYCDVVQSVDRLRLVTALGRGAARSGRTLDVLLQVSLDPPGAQGETEARSGADPVDLAGLADAVAGTGHLRLRGLMAVAPRAGDPAPAFERLAALAARLRADHPAATVLSAGMSGDLEQAVAAGATHVRVGRAVLGERPSRQ
jgi:pyridoxal phosphate enzyme (YggS family)